MHKLVKNVLNKNNSSFKKEIKKIWKLSKKLKELGEKLELRPKDPDLWEEIGDLYDKPQIKFKSKAISAYENAIKYSTAQEKKGNLFYSLGLLNEELGFQDPKHDPKHWKKAKDFFKKEIAHTFPGWYIF